jgi:peptidoglycan/LPS O-acetylase OafA/YrhL
LDLRRIEGGDQLMQRQHYHLLDGVRGLAAIAIMYRHMGALGVPTLPQSYLGVDLFFVLSGAVIANAYEEKLTNGMRLSVFMARRAARLYPMILLGLTLGVLNGLFGDGAGTDHLWLAATLALVFLPNNPIFNLGNLNGPAWSLTYELASNAAYGAGIYRLSSRLIVMFTAAAGALLVVAALYKGHLDTGYTLKSAPFGFARVGFSFFAGVLLFRLHKSGSLRLPSVLQGKWAVLTAVVLLAASLLTTPPESLQAVLALFSVFLVFPAIVVLGLEC